MNSYPLVHFFSSAIVLITFAFANYAHADSPEANNDLANNLLPLETRSIGIEANPNLFKSVADEFVVNGPDASGNFAGRDVLGAGFLEGLVDENGDVDLPLGITVFDAMGTTSIGFGGDF
jgi:hypothetical protein